jgi:hypothetical protein
MDTVLDFNSNTDRKFLGMSIQINESNIGSDRNLGGGITIGFDGQIIIVTHLIDTRLEY